jgi:ribosomal protein L25 (general stress protein Ctc)
MPRKQSKPRASTRPRASEELVVIYTSNGLLGAEVIKSKLESKGIPAILKSETAESVFPLTVDGLGEVRVLVHAEDEKKARKALEVRI